MTKVIEFRNERTIDAEAADWLARLDDDVPLTTEEREELSEWVNRDSEHSRRIRELAMFSDELNVLTDLAIPLNHPISEEQVQSTQPRWTKKLVPAAIVVVFAALTLWGASYWYIGKLLVETNGFYATAVGDQASFSLSDGSTVMLNTDTQIRVTYSRDFRDIHLLRGEAHFDVEQNGYSSFRVFAGKGRIDAVGTAFSVYLTENSIEVAVTEGRVELASTSELSDAGPGNANSSLSPAIPLGQLVAGQAASISLLQNVQANGVGASDVVQILEDDALSELLSWRDGVLVFSGEPLEDVVREISRYTTITIELEEPDLRAMRVGGRFPVSETDAIFDVLARDFGLQVTRVSPDHVIISTNESN